MIALKFFATGSYQLDVGNNWFNGVSQSSVSRSINEVTWALNRPEAMGKVSQKRGRTKCNTSVGTSEKYVNESKITIQLQIFSEI